MAHKNPWHLITSEEICGIQDNLQGIRQQLPDGNQERIVAIQGILDTVQDRQP